MSTARWLVVVVVISAAIGAAQPGVAGQPAGSEADRATRQAAVERLDRMPLLFVPEEVSPDGPAGFVVRGRETSVWLRETGIAYRLHGAGGKEPPENPSSWVVAFDLVGAMPRQPVGENPLPTKVSYFKGPKEQWRTALPSYGSVRYREPWPGVDLVVSGTAGELESTFVVRPGADPGLIRLAYRGASEARLDPDGSLVVDTPLGSITEQAPVAYQEIDGRRVEVAAAFELEPGADPDRQAYRFRLGDYDPARELVVDPVTLVYCGYIGGSEGDNGYDIAVDAAGNAYVTGTTSSTEATFPVTVGPDLTWNGGDDAFVAKINAAGTGLDYCGYVGGSGIDRGTSIAIDVHGNAHVAGYTDSNQVTFPVTVGPDLTFNGGDNDVFVVKINPAGTALDYCGYIGGSGSDTGAGIEVDLQGDAYLTGRTNSSQSSFPVTVGPDLTFNGGSTDAFVAKVNAAGTGLVYCGFLGGSGDDSGRSIDVDPDGNAYLTGSTSSTEATFPVTAGPDLTFNDVNGMTDAFVGKVNASGTALDYCGYIGGSTLDDGLDIAVDGLGNAYVTGLTFSTEATFPVAVGPDLTFNGSGGDVPPDAFVAKVNVDGTALTYCGYIGGSDSDSGYGISVDRASNAYVTGRTRSTEATLPVAIGPDLSHNGGSDGFIARVNAAGTGLDYCGYIGGTDSDWAVGIAVDVAGNAYVAGYTESTEASFPVTVGPDLTFNGGGDAFVAKVSSPDLLLSDGFESGDTSAWSATVP